MYNCGTISVKISVTELLWYNHAVLAFSTTTLGQMGGSSEPNEPPLDPPLGRTNVTDRWQTTDKRQTDARRHIANVNMSSRSLKNRWRHNSARDRLIKTKFGRLTQNKNHMPMTTHRSKSKEEIVFQHGGYPFSETGSSFISTVDWDMEIWYANRFSPFWTNAVTKAKLGSRFPTLWPPSWTIDMTSEVRRFSSDYYEISPNDMRIN